MSFKFYRHSYDNKYILCVHEKENKYLDKLIKKFNKLVLEKIDTSLGYSTKRKLDYDSDTKETDETPSEAAPPSVTSTDSPMAEPLKKSTTAPKARPPLPPRGEDIASGTFLKAKYIVSFGFEFETSFVSLLTKKSSNKFTPYLQRDKRHTISLFEPFINNKEKFEITADSLIGDDIQGFVLNKKEILDKNPLNEFTFIKKKETKEEKTKEITINLRKTKSGVWGFDDLEFIYTLPTLNDPISPDELLDYSCKIRQQIVYNFFGKYYNEREVYKVQDLEKYEFSIYEPVKEYESLPTMIVDSTDSKIDVTKLSTWDDFNVQATVGIKYENIIEFMKSFLWKIDIDSLERSIAIERWFTDVEFDKKLRNWVILKLFYAILDINYAILALENLENLVLEDEWKSRLKSDFEHIKNQYTEWLGLDGKEIDKKIQQGIYDFRRTLLKVPSDLQKETEDHEDSYFVGKNHNFCIRHSLYDILYKKLNSDKEECIKFLKLIIEKFEFIKKQEPILAEKINMYYLDYVIIDIQKGILYFEKMKTTKMDLKTFAKFYDPDLSMELNYDQVQIHTKHRIKKYSFLTKSTDELQEDVLLFEIRNFGDPHDDFYFEYYYYS